jgi:hypothetical protein
MSDEPDEPGDRRPRDPKAQLEADLVEWAMEPWRKGLTAQEEAGMRLVLDMFVTTHPAMQSMLERRLQEEAGTGAASTADEGVTVPDVSGIVSRGGAADEGLSDETDKKVGSLP